MTVRRDILLYIESGLAVIPQKLDLPMTANWAKEEDTKALLPKKLLKVEWAIPKCAVQRSNWNVTIGD